MTARDAEGNLYLVIIRDEGKRNRWGGSFNALPGGKNREGEYPHEAVVREIKEETGLSTTAALCQPRELGKVELRNKNKPDHDVYWFEIRFPLEYLRDAIQAVAEGRIIKKEKGICVELRRAPLDPREFLGSHYAQMQEVAPPLHRELFA